MPETLNPALIEVPGTPWVVLRNDSCLSKWAMESGTILGETHLLDLPEYKAIGPGSVFLDCGGFLGDTSAALVQRGVECWIFEPYRDCYDACRINCPGAHVLNVAVGDGRRMKANGVFGENNGNAGTRMVTIGEGEPSFRIDSLNLPRLDFGKYDLEGAELCALEGSRQTILRCKPKLLIEIYDGMLHKQGFKRQDIFDFIESVGYKWRVAIGRIEDERLDILCEPK